MYTTIIIFSPLPCPTDDLQPPDISRVFFQLHTYAGSSLRTHPLKYQFNFIRSTDSDESFHSSRLNILKNFSPSVSMRKKSHDYDDYWYYGPNPGPVSFPYKDPTHYVPAHLYEHAYEICNCMHDWQLSKLIDGAILADDRADLCIHNHPLLCALEQKA